MPVKCLLLTSFDEEGLQTKQRFRRALEGENIYFIDPEELSSDIPLTEGLFQMIRDSDIIMADLSDNNSNILFEIGFASGLGKIVAVLVDEKSPIPTSLAQMPVLRFAREEGITREQVQRLWASLPRRTSPVTDSVPPEHLVTQDGTSALGARNPFDAVAAEQLSPEILRSVFVATTAQENLNTLKHTVLVGPRGSGKTTLLQMMRLSNYAPGSNESPLIAGVYINFSTSAHYLGDSEVLGRSFAMTGFFNLLMAEGVIEELSAMRSRHRISDAEFAGALRELSNMLGSHGLSDEPDVVIRRLLTQVKAGEISGQASVLLGTQFPDMLARKVRKQIRSLNSVTLAYLIDDYSNDWLPESARGALNGILFSRRDSSVFKVATIAGRSSDFSGSGTLYEPMHDYDLVDLGDESFVDAASYRVTREILSRRFQYAGWGIDPEAWLGTHSPEDANDYSGLAGLSLLTGANYAAALNLSRQFINRTVGNQVPPKAQNWEIRQYSERYIGSLKEWQGTGTVCLEALRAIGSIYPHVSQIRRGRAVRKPTRRGATVGFEVSGDLSGVSDERLAALVRSGAFHARFARSGQAIRLTLNRLLFPALRIPLYGGSDFLRVNVKLLALLFDAPKKFVQLYNRRLQGSSTDGPRLFET
jgi:hypothetical protein